MDIDIDEPTFCNYYFANDNLLENEWKQSDDKLW